MIATILSDKRPIIKISINGNDAYALVDTGASLNLIDDNQLKSFKISPMGSLLRGISRRGLPPP